MQKREQFCKIQHFTTVPQLKVPDLPLLIFLLFNCRLRLLCHAPLSTGQLPCARQEFCAKVAFSNNVIVTFQMWFSYQFTTIFKMSPLPFEVFYIIKSFFINRSILEILHVKREKNIFTYIYQVFHFHLYIPNLFFKILKNI